MDFYILRNELINDPLVLGYASMTDQQAADSLNGLTRSRPVRETPSYQVFEATIKEEYDALSAANRGLYNAIISMGTVNLYGTNTLAAFQSMFAVGSTTRANLIALRVTTISRATELGLPNVGPHHVATARS